MAREEMAHSCLIVAGEKSGEEHALSFIDYLKEGDPKLAFWGVGGNELKDKGVELFYHLRDFSSWGYSEVFQKIPFYLKALKKIEEEVERRHCRVAILIDFQSFNLKLAEKLHRRGVKVLYYVAPQAWAWKSYRVKKLAESVSSLFTIIPFEKEWFESRGVQCVRPVPHPVWLTYRDKLAKRELSGTSQKTLLLLPGSRNFEVKELLPLFVETLKTLQKETAPLRVALVKSSNVSDEIYSPFLEWVDETFEDTQLSKALGRADLSLAASGTVTLTCALFQVPTVVTYKSSRFNQWIYETFVSYRGFISLANIVHEKEIFPEFVQDQVSAFNLVKALRPWLTNPRERERIKSELEKTRDLIGGDQKETSRLMLETIHRVYT